MCVSHTLLSRVKEGMEVVFFNEKNEQNFAKFLLSSKIKRKKREKNALMSWMRCREDY